MGSEPCLFSDHKLPVWPPRGAVLTGGMHNEYRVSFSWIPNQLKTWILNQTLLIVHSTGNDSYLPPLVAANISISSSVNVCCYFLECLVQIKLLFAAPLQTFGLWWKHGGPFSVFIAQNIDCDVLITKKCSGGGQPQTVYTVLIIRLWRVLCLRNKNFNIDR